jgi:hypothetical protein
MFHNARVGESALPPDGGFRADSEAAGVPQPSKEVSAMRIEARRIAAIQTTGILDWIVGVIILLTSFGAHTCIVS